MAGLADSAAEAGGAHAPLTATANLRAMVQRELADAMASLARPRSGDVPVAFAPGGLAALPADPRLRADPGAVNERTFLLAAATVRALVEAGGTGPILTGGEAHLVVSVTGADPELAVIALGEVRLDRVRPVGVALPAPVIAVGELRPPVGENHPLLVAERVARLGGDPTDPASLDAHEEAVLASVRPHEDPDPAGRVARRILQRLNGMGKWGGYHTEFIHLSRGFAGNERALAMEVGEALLAAGLLAEKRSVGQRHVFLNPRRAGDIHRLIDAGERPAELRLPEG